jgi:hypothetical protein
VKQQVIEQITGRIVDYNEKTGELTIKAVYPDFLTLTRREYDKVSITLHDSRPLSGKQRRSCYAMLGEISEWSGQEKEEVKQLLKLNFWTSELWQTADSLFSLSDAPMSVVAAFQSWLARFIVANDVPTKRPMLDYVDDIPNYVYACLCKKKCCICGKHADLHHSDAIGAGRDRTEIIHEGIPALPLCREHHTECHKIGQKTFEERYHIIHGIELDKHLCKVYGLKTNGGKQ